MIDVKSFCSRIGIKQKELAKSLGIKPETIYKWNTGENSPTYDVIVKLKRMGITDFELYGEVFPSQEDDIRKKAAGALSRFMSEIGIKVDSIKEIDI